MLADIGVIGLAVMGENLVMNMERNGYTVAVYNRELDMVDLFINGRAKEKKIIGAYSLESLVSVLKKPRKVMMMIKAGQPVDDLIMKLIKLLDKGDIIIDGGNSFFSDTERRMKLLEENGLLYIGAGVSGGEEGALKGPSIMPGGSLAAWEAVKPILQSISAKTDNNLPCCDWVGSGGAGHFVKMTHNGIEYGDMQLICESYHLMKELIDMTADEMRDVFDEWNKGKLDSYLIEITRDILGYKDTDGQPLVEKILDRAKQKGTGKWAVGAALDEGSPLTLIGEAVFARCLSSMKEERVRASKSIEKIKTAFDGDKKLFTADLKNALYLSKIISYAQLFDLMKRFSKSRNWQLNLGKIALMWRSGCIIRSVFLEKIKAAYDRNPELDNLLLDDFFKKIATECQMSLRRICAAASMSGVPIPAFSTALSYFDGYISENLPHNLLQAQRDYFGAHTYERKDRKAGECFHTDWTGRGGNTLSTNYNI